MLHAGFSGCGKWGCSQAVVRRLLIAVVSLVAEHGLQGTGSVVVGHRLSCPEARGGFPGQGLTLCSPHQQWIPIFCTTRNPLWILNP